MKEVVMEMLKKIIILFPILFLASCMARPDIHLRSGDMSMEVNKSAFIVGDAAYSPDGKFVLSGGKGNKLMIWDVISGKMLRQFEGHTDQIIRVGFSHDGKYALSGSWDKTIRLWDVLTGSTVKTVDIFGTSVLDYTFSHNGRYAISAHLGLNSRILKVWDLSNGSELNHLEHKSFFHQSRGGLPMAFSPDNNSALTINTDGNASLWRVPTGEKIETYDRGKDIITKVDFSPNGNHIIMAGYAGSHSFHNDILKLIEVSTRKEIWRVTGKSHVLGNEITSVKFSPDGNYILSAKMDGSLRLWDAATGTEIKKMLSHSDKSVVYWFPKVNFSPDGKYAVNTSQSAIRIFKTSTGEEIAMMIGFEDGEWLAITSEGYYNASEKGAQYLNVKFEGKDYKVDQFYDVFYRPDIVAAKLRGEDISGLVTITMQDAIKSPPPVVELTSKISDTDQPRTKVCYQVKSSGGGIGEVRLFHNGKLIQSDGYYREVARSTTDKTQLASLDSKAIYEDMRSVSIKGTVDSIPLTSKSKGDVFEGCRDIDAVPGDNEVSVTAFNSTNTVQGYMKTINFNSKIKTEDSHLYILAVGIDQYKDVNVNLKYAVKDAKDLEEKLKVQSSTLYKTQNIHYSLLTDKDATKTNIVNKVNELSNTINPQDGFILFVAGHGVLLQNQYYMLTHDYDGMVNDNSMISSNEIVEMSKKIKSLSQLFIFDTCHAGGVDTIVSGLYDARMSVLAKKMGLHIYASASDKQEAIDGYKGNGLFTYALLDGLNNNKEADKNKDGKVSVVGLGGYSKKMTTDVSKQIGHTQTPLIINFGKDYPIYRLR